MRKTVALAKRSDTLKSLVEKLQTSCIVCTSVVTTHMELWTGALLHNIFLKIAYIHFERFFFHNSRLCRFSQWFLSNFPGNCLKAPSKYCSRTKTKHIPCQLLTIFALNNAFVDENYPYKTLPLYLTICPKCCHISEALKLVIGRNYLHSIRTSKRLITMHVIIE